MAFTSPELDEIPYNQNQAIELLKLNGEVEKHLDMFFRQVDQVFYLNLFAANFVGWNAREFKHRKIITGN